MINYYIILEIPNFSEEPTIKKAYRTLSKKYHPDVNKYSGAVDYFLKVKEAYEFLMNENKRLILNQFLITGHESQSTYQQSETFYQAPPKPIIHYFSTDRKNFVLGDYVLIQWNVSQCKSVAINLIGDVNFSGTHYLKIEHFIEEIVILMTVIGLNDVEYKYQIKLFYKDDNPSRKAFYQVQSQIPDTDEIHFKAESFFGLNARISRYTFKNRMIFLGFLILINSILFITTTLKVLLFFSSLFLLGVIFSQCYKRIHDTEKFKKKVGTLFIPLYNLIILKQLFVLESEPKANQFGIVPDSNKITFKEWFINRYKILNDEITILHKLSFVAFLMLILVTIFKITFTHNEQSVQFTSSYVTSSRPSQNGYISREFFVVFDEIFTVNVSDVTYNEIVFDKKYKDFKIAYNILNEVQYVRLIDSKNNESERIYFGLLQSSNPLLLIVGMVFLSQLYVVRNLRAPKELSFSNGYSVFCLFIYLYAIYLVLF